MNRKVVVVDAGNTMTKFAVVDNGEFLEKGAVPTKKPAALRQALSRLKLPVALASVVPDVTERVRQWCCKYSLPLFEVGSSSQSLVKGPDELGADLVAGIAAALMLYGKGRPVAVLGLGTAITLTATAGDGTFRGSWFTLGARATHEELARRCALLNVVPPMPAIGSIGIELGTDTPTTMTSGVLLATAGAVRAYAEEARKILGKGTVVVATGGDSEAVVALINKGRRRKLINHVDDKLTLNGIYLLYLRESMAKEL